jgi:hypothetical protein
VYLLGLTRPQQRLMHDAIGFTGSATKSGKAACGRLLWACRWFATS